MALLVAILVVAALLAGFLWLTYVERARGVRVFGRARAALDAKTAHIAATLSSETAWASLRRYVRVFADHVVHDIAHVALVVVRSVERSLTRLTRTVRTRLASRARKREAAEQENPTVPVE